MQKNTFFKSLVTKKKIIIISMYILLIPLALIILYIHTYFNNKTAIFGEEKINFTKHTEMEGISFDFYAFSITDQEVENGDLLRGKKYNFAVVVDETGKNPIQNSMSVSIVLGHSWTKYQSSEKTRTINLFDGKYINKFTEIQINQQLPIKVLPLVKIKELDVYVSVSYRIKNIDYKYYLKYTYDEYVTSKTLFY